MYLLLTGSPYEVADAVKALRTAGWSVEHGREHRTGVLGQVDVDATATPPRRTRSTRAKVLDLLGAMRCTAAAALLRDLADRLESSDTDLDDPADLPPVLRRVPADEPAGTR